LGRGESDLKTNKVYYPWGGTSRGTLSKSSQKKSVQEPAFEMLQ
jgi:hypothetical protein